MSQAEYLSPGVYREEVFLRPTDPVRTGVPAFLGLTEKAPAQQGDVSALRLARWPEFGEKFGLPVPSGHLGSAVRGFFDSGGSLCYVFPLQGISLGEIEAALERLEGVDRVDLVCAPDLMQLYPSERLPPPDAAWVAYVDRVMSRYKVSPDAQAVLAMQNALLKHCDTTGDRFAILDPLLGASVDDVIQQKHGLLTLRGNGALYYPWLRTGYGQGPDRTAPPSGHVAGVYAGCDLRVGVHKAPANEELETVEDLETQVSNTEQNRLNPHQVNCLRAFPGRGIRIWGARALADAKGETAYVSVRRLLLTIGRWVARNMRDIPFEPNDQTLWERIKRDLGNYLNQLYLQGALKGTTQGEAFFIKCDGELNSRDVRDRGMVLTETGVAPTLPGEFIVLRLVWRDSGVAVE